MTDVGFDRSKRLLNGREYQTVFDGSRYKVGHKHFLLLARENGLGHPRLGLVVGKKNIRRAVARNRAKRVARETFRRHSPQLDSLDVIFLVRKGFDALPPAEQTAALQQSWRRLSRKLAGDGGQK